MKEIDVTTLYEKMQEPQFDTNNIIVDVRVPGEYRAERIPSAINIPLHKLEKEKERLSKYDNVFLHCETGGRSSEACTLLENMALDSWVNIHGGIELWRQNNLPTIRDGAMSMQRQIMITAGSLILISTILAVTVNIWIIALAVFVGAGLTFAGVTNNCGMALVLRKMPWNN